MTEYNNDVYRFTVIGTYYISFLIVFGNGTLSVQLANGIRDTNSTHIQLNKWSHFVCMRNYDNIYLFLNGSIVLTQNIGSSTTNYVTTPLILGAINTNPPDISFQKLNNAYLSQTKISNTLRYSTTTPFIPPVNLVPLTSEIPNTLFYLSNNYKDIISNTPASMYGTVTSSTILNYN
jgi:hypothetical protein